MDNVLGFWEDGEIAAWRSSFSTSKDLSTLVRLVKPAIIESVMDLLANSIGRVTLTPASVCYIDHYYIVFDELS